MLDYVRVHSSTRGRDMDDHGELEPPPMPDIRWNIGREGRAWTGDEGRSRWELTPEKFEMDRGKLLENVGVDRVVRLGDPDVWRAAIRELG